MVAFFHLSVWLIDLGSLPRRFCSKNCRSHLVNTSSSHLRQKSVVGQEIAKLCYLIDEFFPNTS